MIQGSVKRLAPLLERLRRYRNRLLVATTFFIAVVALVCIFVAVSRGRLVAPEATVLLHDRHGVFLGEIGGDEATGFGYWPVEHLPERVVAATLAIEDRRFWRHPGVDVQAIGRALIQNVSSRRRISGASTLAMQISRMQNPGSRTYVNKFIEALSSVVLTLREGRIEILRHYLRIVPYGNRIHGIAYAARRYLAKPVEDLSWAEVAFLSAIPQAPARMNPFNERGRKRAIDRGIRILEILREKQVLPATEYDLALAQIREIQVPERGQRPDEAMHWVLKFDEMMAQEKHRRALSSEPIVTTSLDLALQREASWQTLKAVSSWDHLGAGNASLIVLDRKTLEILAWVGSSDYFDKNHKGAIDYVRVPRSPGSTLKPFFYAYALEHGVITPGDVLDDLDRGAGGIGNSDEVFLGPMLPRSALANSRNVPAANLLDNIGLDDGYRFLEDLELHDGNRGSRHWGLGLAIGGMPVTLEQLVRAYTVFLSDGKLRDLRYYEGQAEEKGRRLLSATVARQITLFLADPMARLPGFPRSGALEYPFPVAAKTGTSSNYHDAWTVAWSRRYLVASWVGHPDFRPMNRLSGYKSAARLVKRVLSSLHEDQLDGLEDVGFPKPQGAVVSRLCALTGHIAASACERVQIEYFAQGLEPIARCQAHSRQMVDSRSGVLASSRTPREFIEARVFTDLGPKYARWQVAQGLPHPPQAIEQRLLTRIDNTRVASRISITAPSQSLRILRDPEAPPGRSTLALSAVVDPPCEQVVWYVDGVEWKIAEYPYTARWPLKAGEHTFQAKVPFSTSSSNVVRVSVF